MALFPCARGRHTFRGKASSLYVGILSRSEESDRWKLRLCGPHLLEVYQDLAKFKVTVEDDAIRTDGSVDTCLACFQPATEVDWNCFVTVYPANQEREDYWGKLHVDCEVPAYLTRG